MNSTSLIYETYLVNIALREKCPNIEFFLAGNQSECGKIKTSKSSVFGDFSRSVGPTKSELN